MKRSLLASLIIGFVVSAIVIGVHAAGLLLRVEFSISDFVSRHLTATAAIDEKWQYGLVAVLSVGVAWFTIEAPRAAKTWWVIAAVLVELVAMAWVLGLYRIFFQPLPEVLAIAFSFFAARQYSASKLGSRYRRAARMFSGRLSQSKIDQLASGETALDLEPTLQEATALVCDLADKPDLAESLDPAAYARLSRRFVERATELLRSEGGYIQAADGEGVLALFGFPAADDKHAEQAARAALALLALSGPGQENGDAAPDENMPVQVGISSGKMIVANLVAKDRTSLTASGEALELARRFCVANRGYGSRILIGPRTFELAAESVIARPIDFLKGVDERDRLEIYEVLSLSSAANPEEIARRDSFWTGIVYYREKRWREAYIAFQKALGSNGREDPPVQLYLRRLEPLLLRLADTPAAIEPPL